MRCAHHIDKMALHYKRMKRASRYAPLLRRAVTAYYNWRLDRHTEKFVKCVALARSAKRYATDEGEADA